MKLPTKLIFTVTCSALMLSVLAKSLQYISSTTNVGSDEPCGNPYVSEAPYCSDCEKNDFNFIYQTEGSSCDTNSIKAYNGNAQRVITDLSIAGSVGTMPLKFQRYSSTRLSGRNLSHSAFGIESSWSHNYDWVMRDNGGTATQPIVKITYPDGMEVQFKRPDATATTWNPTGKRIADRLVVNGNTFTLWTADHKRYIFQRRTHSVSGGVFYRIESIVDPESNTYTLSYQNNDDTLLRQVTDPAGHFIKLHYDDITLRSNVSTILSTELLPSGSTGVWKEINLTPNESFRFLAVYEGNTWRQKTPLRVAELEFYDQNNVKITGTGFGSWPWATNSEPAKAFDGNISTHYQYAYEKAGYVGLDLGAGIAKQVSRIRYRLNGTLNSDASITFVGMNNEPTPNYVISHVEGSDGRQVGYDYNTYTEPSGIFQWAQLTAANYTDLTASAYTYKWQHRHVMPVLETADDPRYDKPVKKVRYGYDLNTVVGFVVDEFDNASGQLIVSVRWEGGHIPKLVYPNGKVHRFEYTDGLLMRSVNSFGASTDYTYDANGFLISSEDPIGRTTTYTRTGNGRLISATTAGGSVSTFTRGDGGYIVGTVRNGKTTSYTLNATTKRRTRTDHPDGSYETWTYNTFGQKLTHRLRNGTTESWAYNASGLLTQHTDPAGLITTYTHNALKRMASETRNLGGGITHTTSYEYDDRGALTKMTHPDGTFVQHAYDDYGNRLATLDERGEFTTYTYDSLSRKLTETDPRGNVTAYNYTSALGGGCGCNTGGLPVTITYPDGTITLNQYDKEWRLLATIQAYGTPQAATTSYAYDNAGQKTSMTDPLGRVTTYTYDADGRLISETQATGTAVALTNTRSYDLDGNTLSTTQAAGTATALTTSYTYDVMNRVVSSTAAVGKPAAATSSVTYNTLGQRVSSTDPLGRVTTYTYDAAGRPLDTILPDGTTTRRSYDLASRTTHTTVALGLLEQAITAVTYDSRDRPLTQTDPTGVTTSYAYDGSGLVTSITSNSGKTVNYNYDDNGNRLTTILASGTVEQNTSSTTYDVRNRPLIQTDGAGSTTTMTYDPLGRTLTVKNHLNQITTYTYDLVGNRLTTKEADNLITSTSTYDALNRLKTQKDGKNQTITYHYDALGRMTSYVDARNNTFAFQYDALGRRTKRTEPDGTFQTYTYDAAGRLLVHTKADGATITNHYENANRDFLTKVTHSNGEAPRIYSFDALGRLKSAANAHATVSRSYDAASRVIGETQSFASGPSGSFTYQYDADGNLASHTRPDGSALDYAYNARNLLSNITADAPPPVAEYTYNARNQIAATVVENGVFTATRSYDGAGRLTGITNGTLDTTAYTLSADGRRTGISRNGQSETYGYDNARQVSTANYGGLSTTQSWNYDAAGNRTTATTNSSTTSYGTANNVNEYTTISGGGFQPPSPSYDNNGNSLILPRPDGTALSLGWNIHNEQISATNGAGDTATYQYDALGRRTKRSETIGGLTTHTYFFTNGWNVELEHNGTNYTQRLTWGLDLTQTPQGAGGVGGLVMVENLTSGTAVPHFPTYDGNGNITAWVDGSGTVVARQRYDAFGNIIEQTGTAPSNYGFSTKSIEKVTGLLYFGYRYYDPVTGRWPSRDPIEERGGLNLYEFAGNDGVNKIDIFGLNECSVNSTKILQETSIGQFNERGVDVSSMIKLSQETQDNIEILSLIDGLGGFAKSAGKGVAKGQAALSVAIKNALPVISKKIPGVHMPKDGLNKTMNAEQQAIMSMLSELTNTIQSDESSIMFKGSMIIVKLRCCKCVCHRDWYTLGFTSTNKWDCGDWKTFQYVPHRNGELYELFAEWPDAPMGDTIMDGIPKSINQITGADVIEAVQLAKTALKCE